MLEMLKQALPYTLLALMALWSLSLQREVGRLEQANYALEASVSTIAHVAESNDKAVVEWVKAHEAEVDRIEHIHVELGKADDHHWGDARLPDEYVRVLREAGLLDGTAGASDAAVDTAAGSGNPEAGWNDEPGASRVCSRR